MSVIVDLSLPADEFQLGRILGMQAETRVMLDSMVPLGDKSIPFVRVFEGRDSFESAVGQHSIVDEIRVVSEHDDEILYALDWDITGDAFLEAILENDGTVISGTGTESTWAFELRFEEHQQLSAFREACQDRSLTVDFRRLYNPTKPDAGPWYGLTPSQRTALSLAVTKGYYKIPREINTKELAAEFDISDQAMTERLRRAVSNLTKNTILLADEATEIAD